MILDDPHGLQNSKIQDYLIYIAREALAPNSLGQGTAAIRHCHGTCSSVQVPRPPVGGGGNASYIKVTVPINEFNSVPLKRQHVSRSSDVEPSAASTMKYSQGNLCRSRWILWGKIT